MEENGAGPLPRIGMVVPDALRSQGLQALLGDAGGFEMIPLSVPNAMALPGLELVLIDANATEHLLELIATFRRLRPLIRVIVLADEQDPIYIEQVIGAGAKGYLNHTAKEAELRMAIDFVRDGSVWAPRKVLARLLEKGATGLLERSDNGRERPDISAIVFTKRELEVLRLLLLGQPNREMARVLEVDPATVKAHLGRLMRKAGVSNRTALCIRAIEFNWVG